MTPPTVTEELIPVALSPNTSPTAPQVQDDQTLDAQGGTRSSTLSQFLAFFFVLFCFLSWGREQLCSRLSQDNTTVLVGD